MHIPQHRIAGGKPGPPGCGGAGAGGFVPDDLTAHQEAYFQHLVDDVTVQGDIGLAAQVGYIDARPSTRHQHPVSLLPDSEEQVKVVFQTKVFIIIFLGVIGWGGYHQVHGGIRQARHRLAGLAVDPVKDILRDGVLEVFDFFTLIQLSIHPALVKAGGIVAHMAGSAKGAGFGAGGFLIIHRVHYILKLNEISQETTFSPFKFISRKV